MNKKEFEYFDTLLEDFYPNLKHLLLVGLEANQNISLNRIQKEMSCGFNTGMKLKNVLIELNYIDENGHLIIGIDEINKL